MKDLKKQLIIEVDKIQQKKLAACTELIFNILYKEALRCADKQDALQIACLKTIMDFMGVIYTQISEDEIGIDIDTIEKDLADILHGRSIKTFLNEIKEQQKSNDINNSNYE